ncbi:MAG: hypothetical protein U0796_02865 [Gemmatales bacterium]
MTSMLILAWTLHLATQQLAGEPLSVLEANSAYRAILHAGQVMATRETTAFVSGRFAIEYRRPGTIRQVVQSTAQAWYTPTCLHAELTYLKHDEQATRSTIIRHGNVIYSHRRHADPNLPPLAMATSVVQPDTIPTTHGLLVDPGRLYLEMFVLLNISKDRLRWYQHADGLLRIHLLTSQQPQRVVTIGWFDPAQGYLPVKQVHYRHDDSHQKTMTASYSWRLVENDWHCMSVDQTLYGDYIHNGESFTARACRFDVDKLQLQPELDDKMFGLDALNLPPDSRIADLRKDSPTRWLIYQPDGDPYQKKLDEMLEARSHLVPPLPSGSPLLWQCVMLLCLIALPLLLFPGIGLHLFRIIHISQRLAVR